jgi:DNA-binding transcriptional MerR regulator
MVKNADSTTPDACSMQIGEVAERTGLTQRTLRYYEAIGLLLPASRMDGGFRLYSDADLRRLEQIMQLKKLLGVSLSEIKQIVDADELLQQIRQVNKQDPDPVERRARMERAIGIIVEQLALVCNRIAAMQELQGRYERRLERLRDRIANLDSIVQAHAPTSREANGVAGTARPEVVVPAAP